MRQPHRLTQSAETGAPGITKQVKTQDHISKEKQCHVAAARALVKPAVQSDNISNTFDVVSRPILQIEAEYTFESSVDTSRVNDNCFMKKRDQVC